MHRFVGSEAARPWGWKTVTGSSAAAAAASSWLSSRRAAIVGDGPSWLAPFGPRCLHEFRMIGSPCVMMMTIMTRRGSLW